MRQNSELLIDESDGILVVTLNRPAVANALSSTLIHSLSAVVEQASKMDFVLMVLKGAGSNFCGGFDLGEGAKDGPLLSSDSDFESLMALEDLLHNLYIAPFATAAFVKGGAVGAGADLVVSCDHAIATADAHMSFPGFRAGVSLGTRRLVELVGRRRAFELLIMGQVVSGAGLLHSGLVTLISEEDHWPTVMRRLSVALLGVDRRCGARFNQIVKTVSRELSMEDLRSSLDDATR